jgi:hypothetical protein
MKNEVVIFLILQGSCFSNRRRFIKNTEKQVNIFISDFQLFYS